MKQNNVRKLGQFGFTVVELVVVLGIMGLIATVLVIDFNRQKTSRNILLAKNETVTNLRKVQSNILSSKNISDGIPAKFYVVQFVRGQSYYTVIGIDSNFVYHEDLTETITLPGELTFIDLTEAPPPTPPTSYECVQVIFSAPYGKMYIKVVTPSSMDRCGDGIVETLKDPVLLAGVSQTPKHLYFSGTPGSPSARYIVLSPASGQITAY